MLKMIWKGCSMCANGLKFLGEKESEEQVPPVLVISERRHNDVGVAGSENRN